MPEQIIEDSWPEGWIPSSSAQADFGAASRGLLRMDNLTLDERGSLRLANRAGAEGSIPNQVNSIFAAYVNGKKLRYLYDNVGNIKRNYGAGASLTVYDLVIASGGIVTKAFFGNFLGHVVIVAGTKQYKDRGDIQWPLQIPQPVAPTLVNGAAFDIDLRNLNAGTFTNWLSIESSAYNNAGANVQFTPAVASNRAIFQTIYAVVKDTTNFGSGTGFDTPQDQLVFSLSVDDPTQLNYFKVELILQDPTTGITDEYWAELDYANFATNTNPNNPYVPAIPFTISPNTITAIYINRSSFQRIGSNDTLTWATVKAFRFTVGTFAAANFVFYAPFYHSGSVKGLQSYLCVELNDTGQFLQFSVASTQVTLTAALSQVTVSRPTACNTQCNNIRFYRNNVVLGQFIEVNRQTGAYGFTPAGFLDTLNDADALAAAAIDNSKILNFFRTQLPTDIIDMIYFASRVIYLTKTSFFPSFQLDFGSYDSRFTYELTGTNSEICLFVTKLSVGTFIVATTVDFYQVTGTFALITSTLADGTTFTTQDVNVLPLGISDPAINSSFIEVEGNILYMSARGLRSMSNGTSTLLNTTLDLLFRDEARYGFPAVRLQSNDLSFVGMVSSGTRVYISVPFTNGTNATLVSTYNAPTAAELRGSNYWRAIPYAAALCMCRELDGTVLYGDAGGNVSSLESSFIGTAAVDFLTQFNYGQMPTAPKRLGALKIYIDTGGASLILNVYGLLENGTGVTFTTTISATGLTLLEIDPGAVLGECVAFAANIIGTTTTFELNYLIYVIVQEYPPLTYYAIQIASNFDLNKQVQLSKWPYMVDPLGGIITARVTADGAVLPLDQTLTGSGSQTGFWYSKNHIKAVDWKIELLSNTGMRFYKFLQPDILQEYPTITYYAIVPFSNLGKDTLKKIAKWGFVVDTMGAAVTAVLTADNTQLTSTVDTSASPQGISTEFAFNTKDVVGLDWQLEILAPSGMRFYKFMQPDILQVFPPGRVIDQFGPLDIDREGIVFMMRLRLYCIGTAFHYDVYDNDTLIYSNDILTNVARDTTYEETFPKGVNTSVLRIVMSSSTVFYRFSTEVKVRSTGKETEQKWIKIAN